MDAAPQSIARNTLLLTGTELLSRLLSLVLIILVARRLGPVLMGIYAFGLTFVRLLEILVDFGLDRYIQREIGRRPEDSGPLFSQVFGLKLAIYLLGAVIVLVLGHLVIVEPLKRWVVWILSMTIFFRSQANATNAFFRASQQVKYESVVVVTQRLVYTCAGMAAILTGYGLLTLVSLELFAQVGACATGWWLFRRKIANPFHTVHFRHLAALAAAAQNFLYIRLALTVFNSIDLLMLSFLAGDAATGWYAAALRIYAAFDFVPDAFSGAFLTVLSRKVQESWAAFARVFHFFFKYLAILGLGIAAILGGLAPQLLVGVFGATFQPAVTALILLAPALVLNFVNLPLSNALMVLNEEKRILVNFSVAACFNIALNLWLIPHYQQNGAALATWLSEAVVLLLQLRDLGWERMKGLGIISLTGRPLAAGLLTFAWGHWLVVWGLPLVLNLALAGLGFLALLLLTRAISWKELVAAKDILLRPKEALTAA
jgi:O-antigen/teichoic acid export membrane protein